jgi:hypothetical protein
VPATYEVNRRLAVEAERRGDGLAANVRWSLAAEAAPDSLSRVAALAAARRNAELALHQAVYAASRPPTGHRSAVAVRWRSLAEAAGMPVQTLHRRYAGRPAKLGPDRPISASEAALLASEVEGVRTRNRRS